MSTEPDERTAGEAQAPGERVPQEDLSGVPQEDLSGVPLRRTPTQMRSREKVSRALAAADRIAATEGVEALTLTRVADAAGLSPGALHQYLPDRDAIAAALVARYHGRIEALMDTVISRVAEEDVDDPVAEVIGQIARIYSEESIVRLVRSATSVPGDAGRAHKNRMAAKVHELMVACGVRRTDAVAARVVFTATDAVMHEAFDGDEPDLSLLDELESMLRTYLDGDRIGGD
ncbi:TetR family transcriptional regulator [Gordonia sp. NPDC003376]